MALPPDIEIPMDSIIHGSRTASVEVPVTIRAGEARLLRKARMSQDTVGGPSLTTTGRIALEGVYPTQVLLDSAHASTTVGLRLDHSDLLFASDWLFAEPRRPSRLIGAVTAQMFYEDRGVEKHLDVTMPIYIKDR
jgi:hypothetical protein